METATFMFNIIFAIFALSGSAVMITCSIATILDQKRAKVKHMREMKYYDDRDARDKEYHEKLMNGLS